MHKTPLITLVALAFVAISASRAAEPRAVIEKAIKAMGGEEKLSKQTALTWTSTGKYYGLGMEIPFTAEHSVQLPDKSRVEIAGVFTNIFNADKGWVIMGGESRAMTGDELAAAKREAYVGQVRGLLALLKDKEFTLTALEETKVGDRTAVGIKVSRKDRPDVSLYFDKETGLLVMTRHKALSGEMNYQEVEQESIFSDYKEVSGIQLAMKYVSTRDGKQYIEATVSEYEPVDKFDAAVFTAP